MTFRFSSPDYNTELPSSAGGGYLVTHYDITITQPGGNPANPFATTRIPRGAVGPNAGAFTTNLALSVFTPAITNMNVQFWVREVNEANNILGPYGDGSPTFYGGFPSLGPCNAISAT